MATNINYSPFSIVPVDVLPNIFNNLSLEPDSVALVCKKWKEIVDSKPFREMIRPLRVMGIKQLIMHNPNIIFEGEEPLLPRKFYREYAIKGGFCFLNPGKVKLKIADREYKIVVLNNLEAIASLFPSTNLKTRFTNDSWSQALTETKNKEEGPHWVWEEAKARGFNKTSKQQQEMAEEEDKAIYPERYKAVGETSGAGCSENAPKSNSMVLGSLKAIIKQQISKPKQIVIMSNRDDHVLGKFMVEAILGEREVTWDPSSDKLGLIRVKTTIKDGDKDWPIVVGVAPSGLCVKYDCYVTANDRVGFVCARRCFRT